MARLVITSFFDGKRSPDEDLDLNRDLNECFSMSDAIRVIQAQNRGKGIYHPKTTLQWHIDYSSNWYYDSEPADDGYDYDRYY